MSISSAQLCYDLKLNTHSFHPSDIIICQRWAVSMFNSAHFQNLVLFMCITLVFFFWKHSGVNVAQIHIHMLLGYGLSCNSGTHTFAYESFCSLAIEKLVWRQRAVANDTAVIKVSGLIEWIAWCQKPDFHYAQRTVHTENCIRSNNVWS